MWVNNQWIPPRSPVMPQSSTFVLMRKYNLSFNPVETINERLNDVISEEEKLMLQSEIAARHIYGLEMKWNDLFDKNCDGCMVEKLIKTVSPCIDEYSKLSLPKIKIHVLEENLTDENCALIEKIKHNLEKIHFHNATINSTEWFDGVKWVFFEKCKFTDPLVKFKNVSEAYFINTQGEIDISFVVNHCKVEIFPCSLENAKLIAIADVEKKYNERLSVTKPKARVNFLLSRR